MPQPPPISKTSAFAHAFGSAISTHVAELLRTIEAEYERYAVKREVQLRSCADDLHAENNEFRIRLGLPEMELLLDTPKGKCAWSTTLQSCSGMGPCVAQVPVISADRTLGAQPQIFGQVIPLLKESTAFSLSGAQPLRESAQSPAVVPEKLSAGREGTASTAASESERQVSLLARVRPMSVNTVESYKEVSFAALSSMSLGSDEDHGETVPQKNSTLSQSRSMVTQNGEIATQKIPSFSDVDISIENGEESQNPSTYVTQVARVSADSLKSGLKLTRVSAESGFSQACTPCSILCGYQATWHATHCCGACENSNGARHGPRCDKKSMLDEASKRRTGKLSQDTDKGTFSLTASSCAYSFNAKNYRLRTEYSAGTVATQESKAMKKILRRGQLFHHGDSMETLTFETYDVAIYYRKTGLAQLIASSEIFANITLAIIAINAVYIGVDADHNNESSLYSSDIVFIVCENLFCLFFSFELIVRFGAFERKRNCIKDFWFKFDSSLVSLMVLETWVLPVFLSGQSAGAGPGTGLVKLLRLLRIFRMARLMRAFPELVAMVKGVQQASRAVGCALMLLIMLVYVFGILMYTLLKDTTDVNIRYRFKRLGTTMWTLLVDGSFMDGIGWVSRALLDAGKYTEATIFMLFVLGSALTVMNMLIGVLCEVVSAVAVAEKEDSAIKLVKDKLMKLLKDLDEDSSGYLSKEEMGVVLDNQQALQVLESLQVGTDFLIEQLDMLYEDRGCDLTIQEIMELILTLRGDRSPLMADILHAQHFNRWKLEKAMGETENNIQEWMRSQSDALAEVSTRMSLTFTGSRSLGERTSVGEGPRM